MVVLGREKKAWRNRLGMAGWMAMGLPELGQRPKQQWRLFVDEKRNREVV